MNREEEETLRGSIVSSTGPKSSTAGPASEEVGEPTNSDNTRVTGQSNAQNEEDETRSQTSVYQNQEAVISNQCRDQFQVRPSSGRGDFSVRGSFNGGMRDNRAFLGGYHDTQDDYFDDQASVGSAHGRHSRLFSSRMRSANVAHPIGPPTNDGPHPRLDYNWSCLDNPVIDQRAKNLSTEDFVQIANYQDICRYSEEEADVIQDVFNDSNANDDTTGFLEQVLSHLTMVDKISKNGIDEKSTTKWEHGDQDSQGVLVFFKYHSKHTGRRGGTGSITNCKT